MALPLMARGRPGGRAPLALPGVGQAPPPPGMPAQRRATPQPQPSPGRPGEQSGGRDGSGPALERWMREDGIKEARRRTEGAKRRRRPRIPQEKLVCARPQGPAPQLRPRSLTFPGRAAGVRLAPRGPWHSGRRLPLPPGAPFSSSFSRAGSAPPAGNPAPPPSLPPDRERRDRPGRAIGLSVSACGPAPTRARPHPHRSSAERRSWRVSACAQVQRKLVGGRARAPEFQLRSRGDLGLEFRPKGV